MTGLIQHASGDPALTRILALLHAGFAYIDGRIDPPSSLHRLTLADISGHCETGEVWSVGPPPVACMFLTPRAQVLYLGKLCVDPAHRGRGLARRLIACAQDRARFHGLSVIELQTRVELVENHATFTRLGFVETARAAHRGYDRPTSITMQKTVS